jgi:chorismate dehydratase
MLKIGNVNFLNSYPFQYGLTENQDFQIEVLVPSEIATALEIDTIDIGLVPVAAFIEHPDWQVVSDYCIGALGAVKTVILVSKKPAMQIETICYDSDSRSSNMLAKVLSHCYWKIHPREVAENADARVLIGDKAFLDYSEEYPYRYDLSLEWFDFQQLPFVFAVWAANKPISEDVISDLNQYIKYGVEHIPESIHFYKTSLPISEAEAYDYLTNNISYSLNSQKKIAMQRFKELSRELPE